MIDTPNTQQPEEYECCQFETRDLKAYQNGPSSPMPKETHKWLCILCASTFAGSMFEYSRLYTRAELQTIQAICYVGNAILKAIKDK